jgi:hypothetical protein
MAKGLRHEWIAYEHYNKPQNRPGLTARGSSRIFKLSHGERASTFPK